MKSHLQNRVFFGTYKGLPAEFPTGVFFGTGRPYVVVTDTEKVYAAYHDGTTEELTFVDPVDLEKYVNKGEWHEVGVVEFQ